MEMRSVASRGNCVGGGGGGELVEAELCCAPPPPSPPASAHLQVGRRRHERRQAPRGLRRGDRVADAAVGVIVDAQGRGAREGSGEGLRPAAGVLLGRRGRDDRVVHE